MNVGLTFRVGKGQKVPTWMDNKDHTDVATELLADNDVLRLARFASSYSCLKARHPNLKRPFQKLVFSCVAFNFGPNAWTFKHRDVCNLPFGWCSVQALGKFDPRKGGHLVLWDLKLVVEFPPGPPPPLHTPMSPSNRETSASPSHNLWPADSFVM
ncbi:hypothetical protein K438DRAFT_1769024 [Mycena galopus ATCC 62051]|nr:hypothetical protein K438DRAFT_1769024 [Mycena galopus ATCC 62051]